ncbi:MAG: NAD(P)H-hydrate dehydratase, partial [Hydrotalea sp.]|nr:NAD(P)H-hydrate dehydratase [Hydrotalea sp.]
PIWRNCAIIGGMIRQIVANQPAMWRAALRRAMVPRADDNKYRRGTILIRGGAMVGAGVLCATAARRAGAGLVTIFAGARDRAIYLSAQPGLLFSAESFIFQRNVWRTCLSPARQNRAQVIVIGPGCAATRATRRDVLAAIKTGRATLVDAGGITAFANRAPLLRRALQQHPNPNIIFTPHAGELAALNIPAMPPPNAAPDAAPNAARDASPDATRDAARDAESNDAAKIARAASAAEYLGAVVLLKGATTVVATPFGESATARTPPAPRQPMPQPMRPPVSVF